MDRERILEPDIVDVEHRRVRERRRRRLGAVLWASTIASVTLGVLLTGLGRLGSFLDEPVESVSSLPAGSVFQEKPREGALLLSIDSRLEILDSTSQSARVVSDSGVSETGLVGDAISPAGTHILASKGRQEAPGNYRMRELLVLDAATGESQSIAHATVTEGFGGPASEWSPDGTRIAYLKTVYSVDVTRVHPSNGTATEAVCVYTIAADSSKCFPSVEAIDSFAWAPDGRQIVEGSGVNRPVVALDTLTGRVAELLHPADASVTQALGEAGILGASDVQFLTPSWSSSGRFLSLQIWARAEERWSALLAVFDPQGQLTVTGRVNPEPMPLAWSPGRDVLAYATGVVAPPNPDYPPFQVLLLDPDSRSERLLLDTSGVPNSPGSSDPFILAMFWSPSGRRLAAAGRDEVRIVDSLGAEATDVIRYPSGTQTILHDWGPEG